MAKNGIIHDKGTEFLLSIKECFNANFYRRY